MNHEQVKLFPLFQCIAVFNIVDWIRRKWCILLQNKCISAGILALVRGPSPSQKYSHGGELQTPASQKISRFPLYYLEEVQLMLYVAVATVLISVYKS